MDNIIFYQRTGQARLDLAAAAQRLALLAGLPVPDFRADMPVQARRDPNSPLAGLYTTEAIVRHVNAACDALERADQAHRVTPSSPLPLLAEAGATADEAVAPADAGLGAYVNTLPPPPPPSPAPAPRQRATRRLKPTKPKPAAQPAQRRGRKTKVA